MAKDIRNLLCQWFLPAGMTLLFFVVVSTLDASSGSSYLYCRTRSDTDLRSCAYCTTQQGTLRGRVGPSVKIKPGTPLISTSSEEPFEMEGSLWILVFRPYNVDKPILGYSLRPEDALIAPKNQLDFGVSVQPNQPESSPALPFSSFTRGASTAVVVGFGLILAGLFWLVVRRRRPASAVYASPNAGGDGGGPGGTILMIVALGVGLPLLFAFLTTIAFWAMQGRGIRPPSGPPIWMLTNPAVLNLLLMALVVIILIAVARSRRKGRALAIGTIIFLLALCLKLVVPDISQVFLRYAP
ncbi:MAG: hypothetical protein Q8Q12_07400 [bacterium]|nr:hypothetical protein [bacterium]